MHVCTSGIFSKRVEQTERDGQPPLSFFNFCQLLNNPAKVGRNVLDHFRLHHVSSRRVGLCAESACLNFISVDVEFNRRLILSISLDCFMKVQPRATSDRHQRNALLKLREIVVSHKEIYFKSYFYWSIIKIINKKLTNNMSNTGSS